MEAAAGLGRGLLGGIAPDRIGHALGRFLLDAPVLQFQQCLFFHETGNQPLSPASTFSGRAGNWVIRTPQAL